MSAVAGVRRGPNRLVCAANPEAWAHARVDIHGSWGWPIPSRPNRSEPGEKETVTCSVVACGFDIADDHLVINRLPTLDASESRLVLLDRPAEPVNCVILSGCNAGSVVRGTSYAVLGDVEEAKLAALGEIMDAWEPTGDADPLLKEPMLFQFSGEVDTSTGTAFLRFEFMGDWDIGRGAPIEDVFMVTISTHELSN